MTLEETNAARLNRLTRECKQMDVNPALIVGRVQKRIDTTTTRLKDAIETEWAIALQEVIDQSIEDVHNGK